VALGFGHSRSQDSGQGRDWVSQDISEAGEAGQGGVGLTFVLEMKV